MPSVSSLSRPSSLGHELIPCHQHGHGRLEEPDEVNDTGDHIDIVNDNKMNSTTMNDKNNCINNSVLIGVCMTDEKTFSRTEQSSTVKTDSMLGTLVLKSDINSTSVSQLRLVMKPQITSLPPSYIFVSSQG